MKTVLFNTRGSRMNLNYALHTRRQMLKAGSVVLALPWLETYARADEKTPPKRIHCVCTSVGLHGPYTPRARITTGEPSGPLDRKAIQQIVDSAKPNNYGLRSLVHGIVQSETFRSK